MDKPVVIYGLFAGDRCLYVGRTRYPKIRARAHQFRFRYMPVPPTLRAIKNVTEEDASEAEARTIRYYHKRGQADFNINLVPRPASTVRRCSFMVPGDMAAAIVTAAARRNMTIGAWLREAAEEKFARELATK